MDGEITIGTQLSTDKFDKQIKELEKKISREENKNLKYQAEIEFKQEGIEKSKKALERIPTELDKTFEEMRGVATLTDNLAPDTTEYNNAIQKLQELELKAQTYNVLLQKLPNEIEKQESAVEKLKDKQVQVNDKIEEYQNKINNIKLDKMNQGFNQVGNSIQSIVKKVGGLVLGIFAARSAISFLKSASSELANYDKQYATNLEYIRYALTQAIAPVLQGIVYLAMKLLQLINMIVNALFGVNLFSKGSAESFQKMKSGANGVGKAVKEIKKQLTGFDEINMLTDQSDTGTSAGAGGVGMPSFDLSALSGKTPEWLKWLVNNKDLILAILAGIAAALVAIKLGLTGIQALGIGLLVGGLVYAIQNLIKYLKDPSWINFGKIIQGIGVAIIGLGVAFLGLPAIIVGVIVLIVGTIIKYWEQIKAFLQSGIDWLTNRSDWVHKMFGDVIGNIYDTFIKNLQLILNWFDMTFKNLKKAFDGFIEFIKGVFTGNWEQAWEGIKKIFGATWDWIKNTVVTKFTLIWNSISSVISAIGNIFIELWNKIIDGANTAFNWIIRIFSNIGSFFSNVINNILGFFGDLGYRAGEVVSNAFRNVVNGVLGAIELILNAPIRAINGLINAINQIPRS